MAVAQFDVSNKPQTTKRVTYGIEMKVGSYTLGEWGLQESQAKEISELLTLNGDKPVELEGITFCRRAPSELSARIAALKAQMLNQNQK